MKLAFMQVSLVYNLLFISDDPIDPGTGPGMTVKSADVSITNDVPIKMPL